MGSIMDQPRPWERDPDGWNKPSEKPKPTTPVCEHEWKSKFDFVYDYDHQYCTKCKKSRMI